MIVSRPSGPSEYIGWTCCKHKDRPHVGGLLLRWEQHQRELFRHDTMRCKRRCNRYDKLLWANSSRLLHIMATTFCPTSSQQGYESFAISEVNPSANSVLFTPGFKRRSMNNQFVVKEGRSRQRRPLSTTERLRRFEPCAVDPKEDAFRLRRQRAMIVTVEQAHRHDKQVKDIKTNLRAQFVDSYSRELSKWSQKHGNICGPLDLLSSSIWLVIRWALENHI